MLLCRSSTPLDAEARDDAAAYAEAVSRILRILDTDAALGSVNLDRRIDVTDADGFYLFSVPFSAALQ